MTRTPQQRSIRSRDVNLRCLDWPATSETDVPLLLLVHPNATTAQVWQPFVDRSRWPGRCIAPDMRGHGETPTGERPNSVDRWADDLANLIGGLEAGPAIVIGSALGATAALLLATRRPKLVVAVVAGDTAYDLDVQLLRRVQRRIREEGWRASPEEAMANYHAANHWDPSTRDWFMQQMFEPAGEGVRWRYDPDGVAEVMNPRPQSLLDELRLACPVLLLRGEHSGPLTPEAFERLATAIPQARAETIADADHVLTLDAPEEFTNAVDDFLGTLHSAARNA